MTTSDPQAMEMIFDLQEKLRVAEAAIRTARAERDSAEKTVEALEARLEAVRRVHYSGLAHAASCECADCATLRAWARAE